MKENWTYKKLGEVFNLQMGKTPARDNPLFWTGGNHKWISIGDLNCGKYVSKTKECITDAAISQSGISVIPKGTVIMSFKLSIGKTAITTEDMYSNEAIMAFHLKEGTTILPDYLCYYLPIHKWDANRAAMGSTLNKRTISESVIPVPPLSEQQSIVRELDLLNDLITKKRAQVAEYDQLQQSLFYTMFGDPVTNEKGWEEKELGEVAEFYNGKAHEQFIDKQGSYILINSKFIASDASLYKKTNRQICPLYKNDIVMVMSDVPNGRALAKCYLITQNDKYSLNQRICAFRNYRQNPTYLIHTINRNAYYLEFDNGNSQTNLRKEDVLACPIPLPPLPLQQEFAKKVEAIEALKAKVNDSIRETETLLASRMDYYFG